MGVRIAVIGLPVSGKSNVAAGAGKACQKRHRGAVVPAISIVASPGSSAALVHGSLYQIQPRRVRSLAGVAGAISEVPGGVAILETRSDVHEMVRNRFADLWASAREEAQQAQRLDFPASAWGLINRRTYEAIDQIAFDHDVDLIEVHRQGSVYTSDAEGNSQEGIGVRARGNAEAGGADIVISLGGGLRSARADISGRTLRVVADVAGLLGDEPIVLPQIRGPKDRRALIGLIGELLTPSIRQIRVMRGADRLQWLSTDEPLDDFPEATGFGEADRVKYLTAEVEHHLRTIGYMGQTEAVKLARGNLLKQLFGVAACDVLYLAGPDRLQKGLLALEHVQPYGSRQEAA